MSHVSQQIIFNVKGLNMNKLTVFRTASLIVALGPLFLNMREYCSAEEGRRRFS